MDFAKSGPGKFNNTLMASKPNQDESLLPDPVASPGNKRRRIGKRSDPEYSPTTLFIRKKTKRKALQLLLEDAKNQDLSDLVEELLAKWVSEHPHV